MKVVRWIIGIILAMGAILWAAFFGFYLLVYIAFYMFFRWWGPIEVSNSWIFFIQTIEVLLLLVTTILGIMLPLRRYGIDRKKDTMFLWLIGSFTAASVLIGLPL
jgi:hypothetical protein